VRAGSERESEREREWEWERERERESERERVEEERKSVEMNRGVCSNFTFVDWSVEGKKERKKKAEGRKERKKDWLTFSRNSFSTI
jgi:hypothetical protein